MNQYNFRMLVFVMLFAGACAAQSTGVSLGDVARKSRTHSKPVMFFDDTNTHRTAVSDDSASSPSNSKLPQGGQSDTAKAEPLKSSSGKASATASDGAQVDQLKKELDSLKQKQSVWSNSAKNYEQELANEPSEFRRQVDEEAMKNDKANVQSYQQKINQVETELSKAQETSHAAGHDQANDASSGGHASQP